MRLLGGHVIAAIFLSAAIAPFDVLSADQYPTRPVRIIAHGIAGSPTDVISRLISQGLGERWGQQFVVDNRPGAGGTIAVTIASRATPDGYTLLTTGDGPLAISPAMKRNLPYNPLKDFVPVAFGGYNEYVLVTHAAMPMKSVSDIVALAKSKKESMRYGSAGIGITNHLGMEQFKRLAGIELIHVPYKGGPAALTDLVGGRIELVMAGMLPSMPLLKDGRLKAIAVARAKRSEAMPDLPTIAETVPGVDVKTWVAFFAPAGTPTTVLEKLHSEITRYLNRADVRGSLGQRGFAVESMTRKESAELLTAETRRYAELVKTLGLKE